MRDFAAARSLRASLSGFGIASFAFIVTVFLASCSDDGADVTAPTDDSTIHTLPDGTPLSIPAGATYFYSYAEITAGTSANTGLPSGPGTLVVSRIDWSVCDPSQARVEFLNTFFEPITPYTWRIPTTVNTPLAGISVLGIFSGNNLEGGIRVPLSTPPGTGTEAIVHRFTSCVGDWVALYGYYIN